MGGRLMEFQAWPKTPRFFRDIVITEKIDGTNAAIIIEQVDERANEYRHVIYTREGNFAVGAQSRKRVITPGKGTDNYGFAGWVEDNAEALLDLLGPGYHYGEWWGKAIQRGYDQETKRFSLFNTHRFADIEEESNGLLSVVPLLYKGPMWEDEIDYALDTLRVDGSVAAPGYMNPEGICIYHTASSQVYKVLLENDELPKGLIPYAEKQLSERLPV